MLLEEGRSDPILVARFILLEVCSIFAFEQSMIEAQREALP